MISNLKAASLAACFLLLFTQCEEKPREYRDIYTGSWDFSVGKTQLNVDSIGQYFDTVYTSRGNIEYGDTDDHIRVNFNPAEHESVSFEVDENGTLSDFPNDHCNAKFIGTDSIWIFLRYGGLGGGISYNISGNKIP